jgi:hypothetical protein
MLNSDLETIDIFNRNSTPPVTRLEDCSLTLGRISENTAIHASASTKLPSVRID